MEIRKKIIVVSIEPRDKDKVRIKAR